MVEVLVTGGAGFIGSNFVRYALTTHPDWRVTTLDKLTYAGRRENLHDVMDDPRHTFVHGDICDAPLAGPLVERVEHRRPLRRRDARRPLDHGGRRFHPHRRRGHVRPARGGAARARAAALRADLDRRGLRQRARGREHRTRRAAAAQSVLGQQGRRGSARLQLLGHLRRAGHRHARVEQLRAVSVSREGPAALRHQPRRRHPGAALRRRRQRPRLAARRSITAARSII